MKSLTRVALVAVLLFACVGCDQVSKHIVRTQLDVGYSRSFLGDTFRLTHTENPGAFLGLGATLSPATRTAIFQVGVGALVLALLAVALRSKELAPAGIAAYTLLAAGGVGNLIDRVARDGHVTDFLNIGLGTLRTGIFNVADVVAILGLAALLLDLGAQSKRTDSR